MANNRTLAGPPGHCCFVGFKHEGKPVGTKITIAEIPTYLSECSNTTSAASIHPERIILFLPDAYGVFYQNNMLVQDFLAQKGFTVLGIDYFMGDPVHLHTEAGFDPMKWVDQIRKVADEVTPRWLAGVKEKYGPERQITQARSPSTASQDIVLVHPYTMELATDEDVVAVSLAHPGLLDEDHFPKHQKTLDAFTGRQAYPYSAGVQHGFAARGDPSSADIRWGKEQSAEGVAMWFHRFLDEKAVARDASSGMI
ncbi:hypothetical protein BT96DRAFT_1003126 [Gymnopus androsaceus JB14]|uniref:Dienelactone hydrolase domain-containing protein n=1 Tax=Gymnopus androsaceus JB14 TaxID=1447944 RepID=A0A6A4GW26_9AGAR|nr:hypothetical protein BT96DRAFT_1003126 [Gymnopus androsaceus JB14]